MPGYTMENRYYAAPCSSQLEETSAVSVLCTNDAAYLGEEFDHCCEEIEKHIRKERIQTQSL